MDVHPPKNGINRYWSIAKSQLRLGKKTAFWNQCAIFPSTFTTLPTDSSTRIPQSTVPGWRAIGTESYNQVVQPTIKSKKKQQWLKNHKLTSSIKFVVYMCFTIFTQAPLRPGWYHVCPFHICTRTLRVKEKRTISLRTSQGVEPNVERPQHPQASEFLWSTPLWNRTNKTWNQQFHHDRKTHPNGKSEANPNTLIFFPVAHRASWGRDSRNLRHFSGERCLFLVGVHPMQSGHNSTKVAESSTCYRYIYGEVSVCLHMYVYYVYIYIHICIYIYIYICIYIYAYTYICIYIQLESNQLHVYNSIKDIRVVAEILHKSIVDMESIWIT